MSQIVKSKNIIVDNIELATEVAKKNGFKVSDSKRISGIGSKDVDYCFTDNRYNFGLKKSKDNKFDIVYDTDYNKIIHSRFIVPYTVERITKQALDIGNQFLITENNDEIIIELD